MIEEVTMYEASCDTCGWLTTPQPRRTREEAAESLRAHVNVVHSSMSDLIERSSLGTPQAKAARDSIPEERAQAVVRRSQWLHLCPVHGIPDCSPLLNGCARLTTDQEADRP